MITRQTDTIQKSTGGRKKGQEKTKPVEGGRQSREKIATKHKRQVTKGKSPGAELRYLRREPTKKDGKALREEYALNTEPTEKPRRKASRIKNKIITTETNERSLDLTESSIQGNGILQEALKSTKFVEAKYLEVLNRMQDMKRREKRIDETRVKQLELAVDRLAKENNHLKYQLSNIQETIHDKKDPTETNKNKESDEILNSIRRFEIREKEMVGRIKELESIINPQVVQSHSILKRDYGSHSKTTVDKGFGSVRNKSSLNTSKTKSDRTPSPVNFKRLLNQAADQLINDPVVGRKPSSSRLLNPEKINQLESENTGNFGPKKHQSHQREKTEYMIENMQRAVMKVANECKYLRKDSREVYSKLENIEKVLEK